MTFIEIEGTFINVQHIVAIRPMEVNGHAGSVVSLDEGKGMSDPRPPHVIASLINRDDQVK
ncbi:MAG TPA: hypothetical protein VK638_15580 [Edaphobacter sp.]|nr:hypothetical protein [Edaphobacter sp.]